MTSVNANIPRLAALCLAACGLYIFMNGASNRQLKVLDDGSLMDSAEKNLVNFRYPRSILSLNAGFDKYRSFSYGVSSFCLLLELFIESGYLTLPALFISAGEIVNDLSDFFVAIAVIWKNIGFYPAVVYGLTYMILIAFEVSLWIGTCKYHESCQIANLKKQIMAKKQMRLNFLKKLKA